MSRIRRRRVPTRDPLALLDDLDLSVGPPHRRASIHQPADAPEWAELREQWLAHRDELPADSFAYYFFGQGMSYLDAKHAAALALDDRHALLLGRPVRDDQQMPSAVDGPE